MKIAEKLLKEKSLTGVLPDGNLMSYPLDDLKLLPIISEIYYKKVYDTIGTQIYKQVYDIGAHIGLFTLRISKQAVKSRITAIEANPTNYKFLMRNIRINGLENRVHGLNMAAGQAKGTVKLWLSSVSRGDSSTKDWHDAGSAGYMMVTMLPIGDVLTNEESCDLLKLDVEGSEMEVLDGLKKEYIKVHRLEMEIHVSIVNIDKIYKWLRTHDFEVVRRQQLYEDCLFLEARNQRV